MQAFQPQNYHIATVIRHQDCRISPRATNLYHFPVASKLRHFRPTCSSFHHRHHTIPDQENAPVPAGALPSTEDDPLRTHNSKSTALLIRHLSPQDQQNPHPPPSQRQEHHLPFSKEDKEKLLELSLLTKRPPQFPGSIFVSNSSQVVKSVFEAENTRLDEVADDVDDGMLMKALEIRRKVTMEVFKEAMKKGKFGITYSGNLISKLADFLDCVMIKAASMKQLPEFSGCSYNNRAKAFINESGVVPLIRWLKHNSLSYPQIGKLICASRGNVDSIRKLAEWLKTIHVKGRFIGVAMTRAGETVLERDLEELDEIVMYLESNGVRQDWIGYVVRRARKMLSCKTCGKKYHRSCIKSWSQNRDLFHWSSWSCPSCRICEVCRRTGDPNKFMFCKRCDGAYHCYCQQPPHKNVGHGPYLCPKHTKCHSCGSSVPGNGLSVRWFLGYTCCDACGRLFVKGNYCPVCLKVYRDSESTPMVCCDICQRWVHCPCDGIGDAKYMQFQVNGNLQYVCPTCRGECSQIRNLEEAVQELWRRRDEGDKDMIASSRADAGLPNQEEIFDISPFSDDEDSGSVVLKNENCRSLKFSLKGIGDSSPRKKKEHGKKSSNKKYGKKKGNATFFVCGTDASQRFGRQQDGPLFGRRTGDNYNEEMQFSGEPATGDMAAGICSVDEAAVPNHKYIDEVTEANGNNSLRTIKIKSNKSHGDREGIGNNSNVAKTAQGPKLVIHLGGRSRNTSSPPGSEVSNVKKEEDLTSPYVGTEDVIQQKHHEYINSPDNAVESGDKKGHISHTDQMKGSKLREKKGNLIKIKNTNSKASAISSKLTGGKFSHEDEPVSLKNAHSVLGKRSIEDGASTRSGSDVLINQRNKYTSVKYAEDRPTVSGDLDDDNSSIPSNSDASANDHKPFLKFKIPNNSNKGNQNVTDNLDQGLSRKERSDWRVHVGQMVVRTPSPLPLPGKEEITYTRGQRSKRRRPVPGDEDTSQWHEDNTMKEFTDANWVLQKLGKDAAGKRVEIHQPSDDSWHRGTVLEVFEGTSTVSIALDDGKPKNFELGKQGIRFVSQKQKR